MHDEVNAGIKIAPALGGAAWAGLSLNEWVAIATLVYILAQTGLLVPKWIAMLRRRSVQK